MKTVFLCFKLNALLLEFGLNKKINVSGELQDHPPPEHQKQQSLIRTQKSSIIKNKYITIRKLQKGKSTVIAFSMFHRLKFNFATTNKKGGIK